MQRLLGIALLMGAVSVTLPAAGIFGQFTLDGTVTVTAAGQILWTSNNSSTPDSMATISSSQDVTGTFATANGGASIGGQAVTINTLTDNNADQPVGVSFTPYNFIDFAAGDSLPMLLATNISAGSGGQADCSDDPGSAAPGQNCTLLGTTTFPPVPGNGQSPFTFNNYSYPNTSPPPADLCCTSTATWNIAGVTSDGMSVWYGQFTATFDTSYQQQLLNFVNNGQVSDAYSGVMTVTVQQIQSVPEPGTWTMMAGGAILIGLGSFKRRKKA
ncbi:MAG TPA: PEP-CTERM sorting domain-containing protein [Bryobacteraceae bacterium]|nr:PEP-CTERM sorting domain-containing protein [Bryobacteraceae bacterium]